ncbi:MAG: GNAT family N-acetyltransferase, partial [Comamonadaceae bacterium]
MSVTDAPAGLRLALVDAPDDAFNGLTYPRYRQVLAGAEHTALRARQLAIGAWLHDVPVGLAYLSEPLPAQPCPEGYDPLTLPAQGCVRQLLSVMVQPLVRGAGVGRRLLAAAAEFAAAAGAVRLDALHSDRLPGLEAYKAVLRSAGWSEPVLQECRIVGKVAWVVPSEADWAPLRARWRSQGYSADAWTTVGDAEREDIARLMRERVSE